MNWMETDCRNSRWGKRVGSCLYVHDSVVEHLPPGLRKAATRARLAALLAKKDRTSFEPRIPNVVKFNWRTLAISWMVYEDFDRVAHPCLRESYTIDPSGKVEHRDYRRHRSPPILHRKELLVLSTHPSRWEWEQLTEAEEKAGLFENPSTIGTRRTWAKVLSEKGVRIEGHRLVPRD